MQQLCCLARVFHGLNVNAVFKPAFVFLALSSVFLLWEMSAFMKLSYPAIAILKQWEQRPSFRYHSHPPTLNGSVLNYAIFDASHYACAELDFLKRVPSVWVVLLLNDCTEGLGFKSCPRCIALPQSWVKEHVYDTLTDKTPEVQDDPVLTRMAAALYVTSLGASWIFFADWEIPIPFSALRRVIDRQVASGLVYNPPSPGARFEPCGHFMDPYTWQNQLPLADPALYSLTSISTYSVHHVIRGCVEEAGVASRSQDNLDLRAPLAYVANGTIAVSGLSNLLVPVQQLWSLLPAIVALPVKLGVRALDQSSDEASLSLLVQRVLWETGGQFGFLPALVRPKTGVSTSATSEGQHGVGGPSHSEQDVGSAVNISSKAPCLSCEIRNQIRRRDGNFFDDLMKRGCEFSSSITQCLDELANRESSQNYFDKRLVWYVSVWTQLLRTHNQDDAIALNTASENLTASPVHFTPASTRPKKTPESGGQVARDLCLVKTQNDVPIFLNKHVITDVLLVVIMNYPYLVSNIPILEHAYGRYFKHIIYCAESTPAFELKYLRAVQNQPVSFIQQRLSYGRSGHACVTTAIAMGYDVNGFLELGDDVALNVWNFQNLPRGVAWFQTSLRVARLDQTSVPDVWIHPEWGPWTSLVHGRKAAVRFFEHLLSLREDKQHGHLVANFLETLTNTTGCDRCVGYEASDIFYVPASIASQFHYLSTLSLKHELHLEIAVPTLLAGLTTGQMFGLRGQYLWKTKRRVMLDSYSRHDHFLHDFRLSNLNKQKRLHFFCEIFLRRINDDLSRLQEQDYGSSGKK